MKLGISVLCFLTACHAAGENETKAASGSSLTSPDRMPESTRPARTMGFLPAGKSSVVLDTTFDYDEHTEDGGLGRVGHPVPLLCFVYKPEHWSGERMILVHHGVLRNADEYRDDSVVLGDRFDALIIAPKFDKERFPSRMYQRGGILNEDGTAALHGATTYTLIPQIAEAMRRLEGRPDMKLWIIGHSAGGQFAMRMSAFQDTGAERIVAANPGTDLFPTRDMPFGWGFGKLPESLSDDAELKRYLAAPLTLYLGTADDHPDEDLDMSPESVQQGPGRYQRGKAAFAMAQQLAHDKGWPCNWRLVEAPGIEHDHLKMFAHEKCADALFGK